MAPPSMPAAARTSFRPGRSFRRILLVALAVVVIPWLALAISALQVVSDTADSEGASRAASAGTAMARDLMTYLDLGIPFDRMVGINGYFTAGLSGTAEVRAAVLVGSNGAIAGRYVAPSETDAIQPGMLGATTDWKSLDLRSLSFPVTQGGVVVGTLIIGYGLSGSDSAAGFMVIGGLGQLLLLLLVVVFEVMLVAYREAVWSPLRVVVALERRAAERGFTDLGGGSIGGPMEPLLEAINSFIVAMNDRYALIRAFLAEIREASFNPAARGIVTQLQNRLTGIGQFMPEALTEARILQNDLFVGPAVFRVAVLLGIVGVAVGQGVTATNEIAPPVSYVMLAAALAAIAARPFERFSWRQRVFGGAVVAILGIGLLPFVRGVGVGIVLDCVLIMGGIISMAAVIRSANAEALTGAVAHGLAGLGVGGGIIVLTGAHSQWVAYVSALLTLLSLLLLALKHGSESRMRPARRAGDDPARSPAAMLGLIPVVITAVVFGLWLTLPIGQEGSMFPSVWRQALVAVPGAAIASGVVGRWGVTARRLMMAVGSLIFAVFAFSGVPVDFVSAFGSSSLGWLVLLAAGSGLGAAVAAGVSDMAVNGRSAVSLAMTAVAVGCGLAVVLLLDAFRISGMSMSGMSAASWHLAGWGSLLSAVISVLISAHLLVRGLTGGRSR